MEKLSDYIIEYPNTLKPEFCDHLIEKFEKDDRSIKGKVLLHGVKTETKRSTDLLISELSDWAEEDEVFYQALNTKLMSYSDTLGVGELIHSSQVIDSGYQIQRTMAGEYYKWHHDCTGKYNNYEKYLYLRIYTYIFYLNDNFKGGRTQFFPHLKEPYNIIPEKGKLILFPANTMWLHQGETVEEGNKYLTTGWIYTQTSLENQ